MKLFSISCGPNGFRVQHAATFIAVIATLTLLIAACYLPVGAEDLGGGGQNLTQSPGDPNVPGDPADPDPVDGSGNGTADAPYVIASQGTLLDLLQSGSVQMDGHFNLHGDIDLTDVEWVPIGRDDDEGFTGTFDGGGHVVSYLEVTDPLADSPVGLFAKIGEEGVVRNVGLEFFNLTDGGNLSFKGAIAGKNYGLIQDVFAIGGTVSAPAATDAIGGLVGENYGGINRSFVRAEVLGPVPYRGGLVGINRDSGSIQESYFVHTNGDMEGPGTGVGAFIGRNETAGTVATSYYDSDTTGSFSAVGEDVGSPLDEGAITALTTVEATDQTNYSHFDFGEFGPWSISPTLNEGYPYLRAIPPSQ